MKDIRFDQIDVTMGGAVEMAALFQRAGCGAMFLNQPLRDWLFPAFREKPISDDRKIDCYVALINIAMTARMLNYLQHRNIDL